MRKQWLACLVIALLLTGGWGCAPKAPLPKPAVKPLVPSVPPLGEGSLHGTATLESNQSPPAPVLVSVQGRYVRSAPTGEYVLSGLPAGKLNVIAESKTSNNRYLSLPFVVLGEGEDKEFDIELKDATDVDRFCIECHPYKGEQTSSRQIIRDLHSSGHKPVKKMRTSELLDKRGFVTCESCHSLHQETGVDHFVLYPFRNGDLCNRCH